MRIFRPIILRAFIYFFYSEYQLFVRKIRYLIIFNQKLNFFKYIQTKEILEWKGIHLLNFANSSCSQKLRIYLSISITWIILVGYLVWTNGLLSKGIKDFRWDEWIWFGLIPALAPYLYLYIWKPKIFKDLIKNKEE